MKELKVKEKAENARAKFKNAYILAMAAATAYLGSALPVFAESPLAEKVKSGINSIYGDIWMIIVPLYALVVLIGCARIFFANGRKAEGVVDWIKRASIAFAAILCTAWIIQLIQNLTQGGNYVFK